MGTSSNGMARGHLRPHMGGRTSPFIFIGFLVILVILGFNYWSLTSHYRDLQQEFQDIQEQSRVANQKRQSSEKENEDLQTKLQRAEKDLKDMKAAYDRKEQEFSQLSQQNRYKEEEVNRKNLQVENLKSDLDKYKESSDQLKNENDVLKERIKKFQKENIALKENSTNIKLQRKKGKSMKDSPTFDETNKDGTAVEKTSEIKEPVDNKKIQLKEDNVITLIQKKKDTTEQHDADPDLSPPSSNVI